MRELKHLDALTKEKKHEAARAKERELECGDIASAAYHGNLDKLRLFIKQDAGINEFDEECLTPLMNAALKSHLDCVKVRVLFILRYSLTNWC